MASMLEPGTGQRRTSPVVALYHPVPARQEALCRAIAAAGYAVQILPVPAHALRCWTDCCFDLLLANPFLDWQEPIVWVRSMRLIAGRRPLIVLADRDCLDERVAALEAGADDAFHWTQNPAEVVARIRSLLRRNRIAAGQLIEGDLHIDLIDRRVVREGRLIRLPLREFDLLANLALLPDRPVSRHALLQAVWRIDFDPGTNRVEVHMSRLRAKVDRGFAWPMLHTIKGVGYALRSRPG